MDHSSSSDESCLNRLFEALVYTRNALRLKALALLVSLDIGFGWRGVTGTAAVGTFGSFFVRADGTTLDSDLPGGSVVSVVLTVRVVRL